MRAREPGPGLGASARQSDGSPDTGDALELQVRRSGELEPEVMRQAARELLKTACQALESAACNGEALRMVTIDGARALL